MTIEILQEKLIEILGYDVDLIEDKRIGGGFLEYYNVCPVGMSDDLMLNIGIRLSEQQDGFQVLSLDRYYWTDGWESLNGEDVRKCFDRHELEQKYKFHYKTRLRGKVGKKYPVRVVKIHHFDLKRYNKISMTISNVDSKDDKMMQRFINLAKVIYGELNNIVKERQLVE